jgi:hypothetical protein
VLSESVPRDARPAVRWIDTLAGTTTLAWWVATALLLYVATRTVLRSVTWYLAVDQYGYLTFAHDLIRGHVFHHWPPLDAFAAHLADRVDVLVQTYVYDHGRLYCRYSPGFPLVLAAWLLLFGDDGAHYLNPVVFLALLVLTLAFSARIFRSRWRGTAVVALVVLCPTGISFWAMTLVRDLPAHLFGLAGLFLLLPAHTGPLGPRRVATGGLLLGFACSIRPDAVLYLLPAALLTLARWWREGRGGVRLSGLVAAGGVAFIVGLGPFLVYNWLATGSPLRATQGMEVEQFLSSPAAASDAEHVGYPPPAWQLWHGGGSPVQGGGLKLENLRRGLPMNLGLLRGAYGEVLSAIAGWGLVLALLQRRLLFLTVVPYCIGALVFFGFWSNPQWRYLVGVSLFFPMLIVEGSLGTLDLVRRLVRRGRRDAAWLVTLPFLALVVASATHFPLSGDSQALARVVPIVVGLANTAALAASLWPQRRLTAVAEPAFAVALVGVAVWLAVDSWAVRARFQRSEMLRARGAFRAAVQERAVVITTEDVGRPAENIEYYSGVAHALYLTDLERWHLSVPQAADLLLRGGWVPYLLIPPRGRAPMLEELRQGFTVKLVAAIPRERGMDYFVATKAQPEGIPMRLYRLAPFGS